MGCRNTVFNAQAQSAVNLMPRLLAAGVSRFRIELVDEPAMVVGPLLQAYRDVARDPRVARQTWRWLQTIPDANGNAQGVTLGSLQHKEEIARSDLKLTKTRERYGQPGAELQQKVVQSKVVLGKGSLGKVEQGQVQTKVELGKGVHDKTEQGKATQGMAEQGKVQTKVAQTRVVLGKGVQGKAEQGKVPKRSASARHASGLNSRRERATPGGKASQARRRLEIKS